MRVIAINGSPRAKSNTGILIGYVLEKLEDAGITGEVLNLSGEKIEGCRACGICREKLDRRCAVNTDIVNHCLEKMIAADGIIIGSPTYFADINAQTKALIDRAGFVAKGNGNLLRRKVGAAVVAVRRAGALNVFQTINNFFLISEMIVTGSTYWNLGIGREYGEVRTDEEGIKNMENLGENMAWLINKLNA